MAKEPEALIKHVGHVRQTLDQIRKYPVSMKTFSEIQVFVNNLTSLVKSNGPAAVQWKSTFAMIASAVIDLRPILFTDHEGEKFEVLLVKKHKAYGAGAFTRWGELGALVKISLKVDRINTLKEQITIEDNGESITDNLQDIVGYCVLGLRYIEQQNKQ